MDFDSLNSGETARFVYLAVLLATLFFSVVFKSRLKASELLKQAMMWVLIVVGILLVYSYKNNFSDFKNRISGELFPSKAVRLDNHTIALKAANDGHFYVMLNVNEVPIRFMIDTGASDIALNRSDAKKVGIDLKNLEFSKIYQTANGTAFGASVKLEKIEIAGLIFNDVYASVNSSNMGVSLLGMSFLRQFKRYEFAGDELILTY